MQKAIIIIVAISLLGCGPRWKPSLRDAAKVVDVACAAAQFVPEDVYNGQPVSYWCPIAVVAMEAAASIQEAVENKGK